MIRALRWAGPIAFAGCLLTTSVKADVELPHIFSDHMVVQQKKPLVLVGKADPGEAITVSLSGKGRKAVSQQVTAAASGRWAVSLPAQEVGEACEISVAGKNKIILKDVLVGEVWVCSGQSNMARTVTLTENAEQEIAAANFPKIRLFATPFATRAEPQPDTIVGSWKVCTPDTARTFSAVGYFFGRNLHQELKVPVGLVNSSVGATAIESWMNAAAVDMEPVSTSVRAAYDKQLATLPVALPDAGREKPDYADAGWKRMAVPGDWETGNPEMKTFDGAAWFRREVTIPADWSGNALSLNLGPIDDGDVAYFNGVKVGAMNVDTPSVWTTSRSYPVPGSLVKPGRAVIAVRITDQLGGGGFVGKPEDVWLGLADKPETRLSLAGDWAYEIVERWPAPGTPMGLYNGMIAPWTSVPIGGVIWYQGESNAGNSANYGKLLPKFIKGWRAAWKQEDLPFVIVQLPNYQKDGPEPGESQWAAFREVQAVTARDVPNVALAVTIDLGEVGDIHPKNKKDVGYRAGKVALSKFHGVKGVATGPVCVLVKVEGNVVRLGFEDVGKGLVVRGAELGGFALAGANKKFVWAKAEVVNNEVLLRAEGVEVPVSVRYGWANTPAVNLYNAEGFPAAPFRFEKNVLTPGG